MFEHIPIWGRQPLADLNALAPGLREKFQTGTALTRHAIIAVLADRVLTGLIVDGKLQGDDHADEFLAWTLLVDSAEEILTDHFGAAPKGWVTALGALGNAHMTAAGYYRLRILFTDPIHAATAQALAGLEAISEETLRIAQALNARWLNAQVLQRLRSIEAVETFNFSADFVVGICEVSEGQVLEAIANLKHDESLDGLMVRFLRDADYPGFDLPVGEANDIEQLAVMTTDSGDDERPERSAVILVRSPGDEN